MALINCSECGKEVSDKADSCPHCGNPMNQPIEDRFKYTQRCPDCLSTNLYEDTQGYSGKRGFLGTLLFGNIGALAGTVGSKKIMYICKECGKRFEHVNPNNPYRM